VRRAALFLPLAALACAAAPPPVPVAARLSASGVAVELSDRRICRAARPAEAKAAGPWSAVLSGCPDGWQAAVAPDPATNPARAVVETVLVALALEGALAPRAAVTVTAPDGRATRFVSPP
jgi:hypothetical protein